MGRKRVIYNPYRSVDFENYRMVKWDYHIHMRGFNNEPAGIFDAMVGEDASIGTNNSTDSLKDRERVDETYDAFGLTTNNPADEDIYWAEADTEEGYNYFSDDDSVSYSDDRDAESFEVIEFPSSEWKDVEHVVGFFNKSRNGDITQNNRSQVVEDIIKSDKDKVVIDGQESENDNSLAIIAHPGRYTSLDNVVSEYSEFSDFQITDGLVGVEVINKGWVWKEVDPNRTAAHDLSRDGEVEIFDRLCYEHAPERPIWAFAANDCNDGTLGWDFDQRFNVALIPEKDFKPGNQGSTRRVLKNAIEKGRTLAFQRIPWDSDGENERDFSNDWPDDWDNDDTPWRVPKVNNVKIENRKAVVDIEDYNSVEWRSKGGVLVDTGLECDLNNEDIEDYLRAHIYRNGDSEDENDVEDVADTMIQPLMIDERNNFENCKTETESKNSVVAKKISRNHSQSQTKVIV